MERDVLDDVFGDVSAGLSLGSDAVGRAIAFEDVCF